MQKADRVFFRCLVACFLPFGPSFMNQPTTLDSANARTRIANPMPTVAEDVVSNGTRATTTTIVPADTIKAAVAVTILFIFVCAVSFVCWCGLCGLFARLLSHCFATGLAVLQLCCEGLSLLSRCFAAERACCHTVFVVGPAVLLFHHTVKNPRVISTGN